MNTKLMLAVSALALVTSASLAQESTPAPTEIKAEAPVVQAPEAKPLVAVSAPAEMEKKVRIIETTQPAPVAPTPKVEVAKDPATTGSTVPAKTAEAATPDLCASAKLNFEQVKKTGDAKGFNRAADAMNTACGTGTKSGTAPKGKAKTAADTKGKLPQVKVTTPKAGPATPKTSKVKVAAMPLKQAELDATYVSGQVDPLTGKPLVADVSPLRFELYGGFGISSGGFKSIESKAKPVLEGGAGMRYAVTDQIGLRIGASLGNGRDAEKRDQFTFQQPSGSPLLRPVTRTIVDTTKVELGPQLTFKAGADYQLDSNWSFGANLLLAVQNGKATYSTEMLPVGPMPGASLYHERASKMLVRFGAELTARYTMANNSFLEVAPFYLSGADIKVPGGGKETVKANIGVTGRIGWSF